MRRCSSRRKPPARSLSKQKKPTLAAHAEREVAATGWLPRPLLPLADTMLPANEDEEADMGLQPLIGESHERPLALCLSGIRAQRPPLPRWPVPARLACDGQGAGGARGSTRIIPCPAEHSSRSKIPA